MRILNNSFYINRRKYMKSIPEKLYLDLIKKALTFSLWAEPLIPLETFNYKCYRKSLWERFVVSALSRLLKLKRLHLCT